MYFGVVEPYTRARERMYRDATVDPAPVTEDVALLTEIRDLLAAPNDRAATGTNSGGDPPL